MPTLAPIPGKLSYRDQLADGIARAAGGVLRLMPGVYTVPALDIDRPCTLDLRGVTLNVRQDWTSPKKMAVRLAAAVTILGGTIAAGGSYAAVSVEHPGCLTVNCQFLDYSYKGLRVAFDDPDGTFHADRCYAASARGNGSHVFSTGGVYPMAYQVDPGLNRTVGRVTFRDCTAGPHPNTTSGGASIKLAGVGVAVVEGFRVTGDIDPANSHTLIVGEGVGRLTVRDSELPRGITHYPDPASEQPDVGVMLIANSDLGGEPGVYHVHDHLRASRLVYRDVRVFGIDRTAIKDETPGGVRRFDGCTFTRGDNPAAQVMWAPAGIDPTITATDVAADCRWSVRQDISEQFGGGE